MPDEDVFCYFTDCRDHPRAVGEFLRAWAFPGKGYGCYTTFDVRSDAKEFPVTAREFEFLWGRQYSPEEASQGSYTADCDFIRGIRWFKHEGGIEFGWYWDGDGSLAFFVPGVGVFLNRDCRTDDEWEFRVLP